jgi:hypothetical protein
MVEMAMCDEHTLDTFCFSEEESYIREKIVKSWAISSTSEFETAIHEEYLSSVFNHRHICTNSSKTTYRDNTSGIWIHLWEYLWVV